MQEQGQIHTNQFTGRTLEVDGVENLFFSGTAYLGIPFNKTFRACLLEGMERYGSNYSSSRISNLCLEVYEEAEAYLAAFTGADAALTLSSGYMAGQVVVQTLQDSGYFVYAPDAHPAVRGCAAEVANPLQTHDAWVKQLLEEVSAIPEQYIIIVCNSVDPLHAINYSFSWIASLPKGKDFTLIIDDSHGFGITGENGSGCYSQLKQYLAGIRLIVLGSLGKAFGVPAGLILGDEQLIAQLKDSPYFSGSSPAVPAYLYAFLQCKEVYAEARKKLFLNIADFRQLLKYPALFQSFDRYPVFSTSNKELYPFLQRHNILISCFRYPTPASEPITRVVLNSLHTPQDLERLANLINQLEVV